MRCIAAVVISLAGILAAAALVLTPAARADIQPLLKHLGIVSCSRATPCQEGKNASTGPGLEGISAKGQGVLGAAGSESGLFHFPAGITGDSQNSDGVRGLSANGSGVHALSINGIALDAFSSGAPGVNAVGGHITSTDGVPALSIVGNGSGAPLVAGCASRNPCDLNNAVFYVLANGIIVTNAVINAFGGPSTFTGLAVNAGIPPNGYVNISGQYQKNGSCVVGCTAPTVASSGRAVVTYASTVSQPTIEDYGEAQLVSGRAYVHLDPRFANAIDQRANYSVFVTPEADTNVLYVTHKSANGFAVVESRGGRSTLPFSYRILATPFGSHDPRLPMVVLPKLGAATR